MRTSPWAPPELQPGVSAAVSISGLFMLASGIWAFFAPTSCAHFVAFPYNRDLLQDVGAFQIGIGVTVLLALLWADSILLERPISVGQMAAIADEVRRRPGVIEATGRTQFDSDIQVNGQPRDIPMQVFVATPDDPMRMAKFDDVRDDRSKALRCAASRGCRLGHVGGLARACLCDLLFEVDPG